MLIAATLWRRSGQAEAAVDLSTMTCKQFFEYDKDNLAIMLMWLDGYYARRTRRRSSISTRWREQQEARRILRQESGHSVITAADKVMGSGGK